MSDCIFCKLLEKLDEFLKGKASSKSCCCNSGKGEHDSCRTPEKEETKEDTKGCDCGKNDKTGN